MIINYVETLSILIKQMTVIDVMAQESVIDVVALIIAGSIIFPVDFHLFFP
ncbi:MAG: hypothetical protein JRJ69_12220 [Deltaproteobacteria bacterium]|nr:hypothetical protein [Deltaproteobacteria bacterium]